MSVDRAKCLKIRLPLKKLKFHQTLQDLTSWKTANTEDCCAPISWQSLLNIRWFKAWAPTKLMTFTEVAKISLKGVSQWLLTFFLPRLA